ncbi:uncharacterized protein LOC118735776 [Rhagoletis pomonella]|uniref:uncharacterized protein LOC118735776 n=1 Tax=Rhagoletis pomonella TaxID=28610 RepID=UPI00177C9394|nr:uncharacterized protein LOC118735776 [Rhagoletis pomonella]
MVKTPLGVKMKLFTIVLLIAFAVVFVEARNLQAPKKFVGYDFKKPNGFGKLPVGGTSKHFGGNNKVRQVQDAPEHGGHPLSPRKPAASSSTAAPSTATLAITTTGSPSAGSSSTAEPTVAFSALAQWCYEQALTDLCRYLVG